MVIIVESFVSEISNRLFNLIFARVFDKISEVISFSKINKNVLTETLSVIRISKYCLNFKVVDNIVIACQKSSQTQI